MSLADVREHAQTCDVPGLVEALITVAHIDVPWSIQLNELKVVRLGRLPCRIEAAAALAERIPQIRGDNARTLLEYVLGDLVDEFGPKLNVEQAKAVLNIAAGSWWFFPGDRLAELGKMVLEDGGVLGGDVVAALRRTAIGPPSDKSLKAFVAGIDQPIFSPGEPWADRALDDLSTLDSSWKELVKLAVTATTAEPPAGWEEQGRSVLATVGEQKARDVITGWLELLGRPRTIPLSPRGYLVDTEYTADPYNAIALRGLVWLLGLLPGDAALARLLADLAETNMRKVPGVGPRNPKVAGAAIHALSRLDADEAGAQLSRLAARITQKDTAKLLRAAIEARADAARGLGRDEVEVPTYGLTQVGQRSDLVGEDTATLRVGDGQVTIEWRNAAGTVLMSAPTAVKTQFPERLKELKAASKDIAATLAAQAERLDLEFLARRGWPWPAWRARYLDHVLLGTLIRRLLWVAGDKTCGFADDCLRALDGTPVHPADAEKVSLWHPLGRPAEEVLAWREWLRRNDIVQPFKQAEREVYSLGDAGRVTGRALHPQRFQKLATARGWVYQPGPDDQGTPATRDLPSWGLQAALDISGRTSGQLHFHPLKQTGHSRELALLRGLGWKPEPKPLEQIPPLVLSEVIRDLELSLSR